MRLRGLIPIAAAGFLAVAGGAQAALTEFQSFTGNVAMSTDGWGGSDGSGVISARAPDGSSVVAAYLYSATRFLTPDVVAATPTDIMLNGSSVTTSFLSKNNLDNCCGGAITTFRADVTSIVKPVIDAGGGPVFDFNISEGTDNSRLDGHALVVVYENPALPDASVGILDGFASVGGDSTSINFAEALDVSDPDFFAEMVLGINFSASGQSSNVSVNGNLLTTNAGDFDDGENAANGSLITVGSFDDPFSPMNPTYAQDTERYDLAASGFLVDGDTTISIDTNNPSNDDNIFLAAFYVKGEAGFNEPPPSNNVIPIPATAWLMGASMLGLGWVGRRKRR